MLLYCNDVIGCDGRRTINSIDYCAQVDLETRATRRNSSSTRFLSFLSNGAGGRDKRQISREPQVSLRMMSGRRTPIGASEQTMEANFGRADTRTTKTFKGRIMTTTIILERNFQHSNVAVNPSTAERKVHSTGYPSCAATPRCIPPSSRTKPLRVLPPPSRTRVNW